MGLPSLSYRADVDGLRAIAILPVVFFHAWPGQMPGGFAGVDVFFVISGFLITSILLKALAHGDFSLSQFYAQRLRRIVPALLLVLAACLAFGWLDLMPEEYLRMKRHVGAGAIFLQNFQLWQESGYFDRVSKLKPLLHLWSLSIEEQFYLFYPLLLLGAIRLRLKPIRALAILALLSFAINLYMFWRHPVGAFFGPHARAWELLAGAWLACRQAEQSPATLLAQGGKRRDLMSLLGLALLVFAYLHEDYRNWGTVIPVAGAMLLLAAGPSAWVNRHLLSRRAMIWVGMISYPLYLWHWPLLTFSRIVDGGPPTEIKIAVVLSFLLAWLTWRYVEQPIRHGGANRRTTALLAGGLAVLAMLSLAPLPQIGPGQQAMAEAMALNSFQAPYRQSCEFFTNTADTGSDWCNQGNAQSQAPDAVLLGDSFANAYTGMVKRHANANSWRFTMLGRGHCPPLVDYGPDSCKEMVRQQQAYVAAQPSISTVILAAYWQEYSKGLTFPLEAHTESQQNFDAALRRSVEYYQGLGRKVVVLLAPPIGMRPRSCIPRPVQGWVAEGRCSGDAKQARKDDGAYRAQVLPYLAERKVAVFDPFPLLCDDSSCKLRDGQNILYMDRIHLSSHGSEWLAQHGGPALNAVLGDLKLKQ